MRHRMKSSFERLVKAAHISELITDTFFFILKIAADQYANEDLIFSVVNHQPDSSRSFTSLHVT
jgi:hypothetical protein